MIIRCDSCQKEFVVPDNAITASGRLVQCSSCGNKWTQYPLKKQAKVKKNPGKIGQPKIKNERQTAVKKKKKISNKKKTASISVYSKEYLKKKHGISLINPSEAKIKTLKKTNLEKRISFGFYNYLLVFVITIIALFGILNYTKFKIIYYFPFLENYIYYLYETIENFKIIILNILNFY